MKSQSLRSCPYLATRLSNGTFRANRSRKTGKTSSTSITHWSWRTTFTRLSIDTVSTRLTVGARFTRRADVTSWATFSWKAVLSVKTRKTFGSDSTFQTLLTRETRLAINTGGTSDTDWTGWTLRT